MTTHKLCLPLLAVSLVAACGDSGRRSSTPPAQTTTERLIELASRTDEVGEPFPVNDGAFVFNDTADDTEPVPVNR